MVRRLCYNCGIKCLFKFMPKTLMADGIHPTAEGYAIWAERIRKELR